MLVGITNNNNFSRVIGYIHIRIGFSYNEAFNDDDTAYNRDSGQDTVGIDRVIVW